MQGILVRHGPFVPRAREKPVLLVRHQTTEL